MKGPNWWAVGMVLAVSGSALAGDFNGDGFDDVAIGSPDQAVGEITHAGAVTILYGRAGGLTGTGSLQITQETADVAGSAEAWDQFGSALAIGNFNGDNYADLAVGVPGKDVGGQLNAGGLVILYGSQQGLTGAGSQEFYVYSATGNNMGEALAAGDFNGDGFEDLAVGIPGYNVLLDNALIQDAGAVAILFGSAGGLTLTGYQFWSQNSTGILDKSENYDQFGTSLAVGDFQNDGYDDLAIGVPYENVTEGNSDEGAVNVIYGWAAGLTSVGNQFWTQNSTDILGVCETNEFFGWSLAAGKFGKGGGDDLAIGVPYEDYLPGIEGGAINMIYGSLASGLGSKGNDLINQDSEGVPDLQEWEDAFGYTLSAGRIDGDSFDDLVVGCPYEDVGDVQNAGQIIVLGGSAQGIGPGKNFQFNQNSPGINGTAAAGDLFGYSLAVTEGKSINGDRFADIVIGIPYKDGGAINCGFFAVIFGSEAGPTSAGDQLKSEDSPGVDGVSEAYEHWGSSVGSR